MQSFMAGSRLGYGLLAKLANGQRANLDLSKRGADLSRGPQALSKLPAAAWSNTWPAPAATLDLDFANNRGFVRGSGQGGAMDAVTFTRASSGNWVDNTGTLRTGAGTFTGTANATAANLLTAPQNFDNAVWSKTGSISIVNNAIVAPDGTLTASAMVSLLNFVSGDTKIIQAYTVAATTYTFSIYAKAGSFNYCYFTKSAGSGGGATVNLQDGTVSNVAAGVTVTTQNVGNGWWRISLVYTATAGSTNFGIYPFPNSAGTSYAGDGLQDIYIWGAQLEVGSSATTYYPTNINAPRFDWASTTVTPNVNLLQATEQFDNAYWSVVVAAVSANTTATTDPLGTNTADLIYPTGTGFNRAIQRGSSVLSLNIKTISVYAKAAGFSWLSIRDNTTAWAFFNLSTGTLGTVTSGYTASITSVGNGWYRCVATSTGAAVTFPTFMLSDADNSSFTTASGTNGFYLWGAQGETGSSATAYQSIGAQSPTNTPLVANSTCNGLLIEESRTNRILWCRDGLNGGTAVGTNMLTYSEQANNAAWVKSAANITPDSTTSPTGTTTADTLVPTAVSATHYFQQTSVIPIATYTASVYAKAAGYNFVFIGEANSATNQYAYFNLSTGTVGNTNNVISTSITNVGSGWYLCTATWSGGHPSSARGLYVACDQVNGNVSAWTGDGVSGIYVWGMQLTPLAFPTTYQTTTTPAVYGWSTSNTTLAKNRTGIDSVANSATTITATANNGIAIQPILLASGSRTGSVYLKRITGTGNVQVTLDGSTWSTVDLSNGLWNRIVLSGTVTNPCVGVLLATNGDAVAMDYAQVEDGAFVTSPILTTTATATRAAETASINLPLSMNVLNYQSGTATVQFMPFTSPISTGENSIISVGSTSGYFNFYNQTTGRFGLRSAGDNANGADVAGFISALTNNKIAASWASKVRTRASNSGQVVERYAPLAPFAPQAFDRVAAINSTTKRVVYWPFEMASNQLQELVK